MALFDYFTDTCVLPESPWKSLTRWPELRLSLKTIVDFCCFRVRRRMLFFGHSSPPRAYSLHPAIVRANWIYKGRCRVDWRGLEKKTKEIRMKLRFVAILLVLLTGVLCSVSSAGPISDFCKHHPNSTICRP